MFDINEIRSLFPFSENSIYLCAGGLSLCNSRAKKALIEFLHQWEKGVKNWDKWHNDLLNVNLLLSQLIGSKSEEIVILPNATIGANCIYTMINPKPGENIVINDLEYHTNTYPALTREKRGVEVRVVQNVKGEILVEDVEKNVDDRTSILAVSHVSWLNGFRHDLRTLAEIAHDHDAYFFVDVAQSAGAINIDVKHDGIDFLIGSSYKWLLAPPGAGFLYIRKDLINQFNPPLPGHRSVIDPIDIWKLEFHETASRFETGTPNFFTIIGLKIGLQLIFELGIENIEKRILELSGYLIEKALDRNIQVWTPFEIEKRAGIVSLILDNAKAIHDKLWKKRIFVFLFPDRIPEIYNLSGGCIRVDPGIYNTENDIDILLKELEDLK